MLATIVELLGLVELGDRRLDLGVVGLHLGGRFPCLLDDLRARAGERAASTKGQRHCYRSNGHDLSQDLSPPLVARLASVIVTPGWLPWFRRGLRRLRRRGVEVVENSLRELRRDQIGRASCRERV